MRSFRNSGNVTFLYSLPSRFKFEKNLIWNVLESELSHIPDHWYNFSAPHPLLNYTLGFLYFIFFVISCIGNGTVIWIFSVSKSLRTPSNVLIINLAIFDFIMMAKTPIMIYNSLNLGFASGYLWCQVYGVAGTISGIGASATNACIAYDRYQTITKPLKKSGKKIKAFLMCVFIWIYTLPWAIFPTLEIWGRYVPEGFLTTCTFDYITESLNIKTFVAAIFTFSYILPMLSIIYFYCRIVCHVIQHEKILKNQAKKMNLKSLRANSDNNYHTEIQITKAAVIMCFLFAFSWTPYGVIALIGCFGNKETITPFVSMIPACTCKAVACIDPYIYAISHPRFRLQLKKRFICLTGCIKEVGEIQEVTSSLETVDA